MLKTQRQIVERQLTIQEAIEQELKQADERLHSGAWSDCSEGERQRRSLRARIAVLSQALEWAEVRNSKRLFQYVSWQHQMYKNTLAELRIQSEKEVPESVIAKEVDVAPPQFVPVSQQQIDEVLNLSPHTEFRDFFQFLRESQKPDSVAILIEAMEAEINEAQHKPRSKEWERLTETQKQIRTITEKVGVCEKFVAVGVARKDPEILRYALRAKECYTNYLDALKMNIPTS